MIPYKTVNKLYRVMFILMSALWCSSDSLIVEFVFTTLLVQKVLKTGTDFSHILNHILDHLTCRVHDFVLLKVFKTGVEVGQILEHSLHQLRARCHNSIFQQVVKQVSSLVVYLKVISRIHGRKCFNN